MIDSYITTQTNCILLRINLLRLRFLINHESRFTVYVFTGSEYALLRHLHKSLPPPLKYFVAGNRRQRRPWRRWTDDIKQRTKISAVTNCVQRAKDMFWI